MYLVCDVCGEAYFLVEAARKRHMAICAALKEYYIPPPPAQMSLTPSVMMELTPSPIAETALDLSIRSQSQPEPASRKVTNWASSWRKRFNSAPVSDSPSRRSRPASSLTSGSMAVSDGQLIPRSGSVRVSQPDESNSARFKQAEGNSGGGSGVNPAGASSDYNSGSGIELNGASNGDDTRRGKATGGSCRVEAAEGGSESGVHVAGVSSDAIVNSCRVQPAEGNSNDDGDICRVAPSGGSNSGGSGSGGNSKTGQSLHWELKKGLSSARDYVIRNPDSSFLDNADFLDAALPLVVEILADELDISRSLRYNLVMESTYVHPDESRQLFNFKTRSSVLFSSENNVAVLQERVQKDYRKLLDEEAGLQGKQSGWSLVMPITLTLRVSRFLYKTPSGNRHTALPKKLTNRKAIINVQNLDNQCFKYAVLSKHVPNVSAHTVLTEESFADMEDVYDFSGLHFPLEATKIKKFELLNPDTSVNLFESGTDCVITPWRVVKQEKQDHLDLLLFTNHDGVSHYMLILDFNKLIKPQLTNSKHNITVCKRCFSHRQNRYCRPSPEAWLQEHMGLCVKHKATPIRLPQVGANILKFTQYETQIPVPIVLVADFESSLQPEARTDNCYEEHVVNSFSTLIKSTLPEDVLHEVGLTTTPFLHRSENAGQEFMLHMQDIARSVEKLYSRNVSLKAMSDEEANRHAQADICDLCEQSFNDSNVVKTLDHCHITGAYRHTLCGACNLRATQVNFIPVYFHNFSSYDQSFIVRNLGVLRGCEVRAIPANNEKFISISVRVGRIWIRFLDSYRLMAASLAELVSKLPDEKLVDSSKLVPEGMLELVKRKGVYPYSYVKSHSVFQQTCLPPEEAFYNVLNEEVVSREDYEHAKKVWVDLGIETFGDYHDFYLILDVCLLMDVLCAFRDTCMLTYRLDCCHHFTLPGLAFRAMLRMSQVQLELLTDIEQLLLFESAIRGGLVQCNVRHAKANNRMLEEVEEYRSDEETSYLLYLDCVNLYGHAMTSLLPTGNFRWVDNPETLDWSNLPADSPHGLILECDIEYPDDIHDYLQQLPPLTEMDVPPGGKTRKLLATLRDKQRYVAHYSVFQQAVKLGLKVTRIHRALSFSQSPWMKSFVETNTRLRVRATNNFDKSFYKIMTNSTYGKLMESVRKRLDVRICTTDESFQKLIRNPRYEDHTIVSEDIVTVRIRRKSVFMNKPIYAGMCVLDLSKVHMNNFFYNVLLKHFPADELMLCYQDTDSLLIHVRTERDLHEVLRQPTLSCHLDNSTFPLLKSEENKGKIGTFKNETNGRSIVEYIGLRSKMYAYRFNAESSSLKAKGIKTAYVKHNLRFQHYKDTLFKTTTHPPEKVQYNLIRTKKFHLHSMCVIKKGLSCEDDKRVILECGIRTLPYGHYRLREITDEPITTAVEDSIYSSEDNDY